MKFYIFVYLFILLVNKATVGVHIVPVAWCVRTVAPFFFQDHHIHELRSQLEGLKHIHQANQAKLHAKPPSSSSHHRSRSSSTCSRSSNTSTKSSNQSSKSSNPSSSRLQDSELQELRRTIKELSQGATQHSNDARALTASPGGYGDRDGAGAFSPGQRRHSAQTASSSASSKQDGAQTPGNVGSLSLSNVVYDACKDISKDIHYHIHTIILFFIRSDAWLYIKWAFSLVSAYGYFNLPQGFVWGNILTLLSRRL